MREDLLYLSKNLAFGVVAGITVTVAIKYFSGSFGFNNIMNKFNYLNSHERKILENSILPSQLKFNIEDIVGQKELINKIMLNVIFPIRYEKRFSEGDVELPKGILFYGPPGCGKTMLAQAIAKELNISFINISLDSIQNKWYGETTKLVKAMFTLAKKIKPCIIFIDEIDSVLANRSSEDHEATKGSKSAFLQLWDGLFTNDQDGILIIGATNRQELLDEAFLSRFEQLYYLPLPSVKQRQEYLKKALKNQTEPDFDFENLAKCTNNFSFRDLKSLCKQAKSKRISKDIMQRLEESNDNDLIKLRKCKMEDFEAIIKNDKFNSLNENLDSDKIF